MDSGRSVNDFFAFYLRSQTWWQLASSLEPRSGKFYDMHILNIGSVEKFSPWVQDLHGI